MIYLATNFDDGKFLLRGLALYKSLQDTSGDFILYNLCMDDEIYNNLSKLNLPKLKLIRISDIEDVDLLRVKKERNIREYSTTCKSAFVLYLIETYKYINTIAWVDADLYFFQSIQEAFDEMGDSSVALTEHNFSPNLKGQEITNCLYNTGFIIFRNDMIGIKVLRWWKDRCIEWCFDRYENGKFGEQLYLQDWPKRFENVRVIERLGINLAYWNIERFRVNKKNSEIVITDKESGNKNGLVFYHYSGTEIYKVFGRAKIVYKRRHIHPLVKKLIYNPYSKGLTWALKIAETIPHGDLKIKSGIFKYTFMTLYKKLLSYKHYFD